MKRDFTSMARTRRPIFGVVGNMGPEADIKFQELVRLAAIKAGATKDQDHVPLIVVKNPQIPDRSEAINEGGLSPVPEIINSVKMLEAAGATHAIMTCNTAHYFKNEVQKYTSVKILDILQATVDSIKSSPNTQKVGLLATTGTCNTEIYDKYLKIAGIEFIKPTAEDQEKYVHCAIYGPKTGKKNSDGKDLRNPLGIKSGNYEENALLLAKQIETFKTQGCNAVILGCTELPLVHDKLQELYPKINFVDPMQVMAAKVVEMYRNPELLINK